MSSRTLCATACSKDGAPRPSQASGPTTPPASGNQFPQFGESQCADARCRFDESRLTASSNCDGWSNQISTHDETARRTPANPSQCWPVPAKLGASRSPNRSGPRGYPPADGPQQEPSNEIVYLVCGLEPAFDMREPAARASVRYPAQKGVPRRAFGRDQVRCRHTQFLTRMKRDGRAARHESRISSHRVTQGVHARLTGLPAPCRS